MMAWNLCLVACQKESIPTRIETIKRTSKKGDLRRTSPFSRLAISKRAHVFSLPALRALRHVELHGLALLKAFETSGLDCREMHKNVFATLTANEAVAFGVVEPLHCSLFCHVSTCFPFNRFTLERFGGSEGRLLACWARSAHDRFGLTR